MANRLKCCLSNLILINQSAFIEVRLLTDNALVAFEVNHCIRRKTQGKYGCACLKIDASKAYDRLGWQFVENMLNKFSFHHIWIDRVMTCIRTVTYNFFAARQGLSSIIKRNEEVGLIHGCKIANEAPRVKRRICEVLELDAVDTLGRYLGIPMILERKKKEVFGFLMEKVKQKLNVWTNTYMSKAGKCTLLKTSGQVVPNFWINLMTIPTEVCNVIQRQMNKFWWGNGGHNKGEKWMA
ncbi:uncharacterized protein LOC141674972 [Apium graveolens]|uniref:uncharacterized protein LOC141674972 n=1 Tax=Apium graveolens TaxID=4045 RepID=UPI003D7A870D